MVPVHIDMGADEYVNVLEILAIIQHHADLKYSFPPNPKHKTKAAILTTSGLIIPAYRAPDILARRWREAFEIKES